MLTQPAAAAIPTTMAASATPAPPSPTKKRRRRAPATGAAEDCFSCRSHGIKCDRRRPYCGPCLDSNQTCKGYRTQLTWGVGVASRGKLRGMSLPVINAVTEQQRKDKITKQRGDGADEKAKKMRTAGAGTPNYGGTSQRTSPPSSVSKLSIITSYDFVNMEPPSASSVVSRVSSSTLSQSAMSANSPAMSAVSSRGPGLPSSRSPQPGMSSPYSAVSQTPYRSPILPQPSQPQQHAHHHHHHQPPPPPPPQQHQQPQQHYQGPPSSNAQYHKSPYSHVSMPPQQAPSMMLSPMSEYEPSFTAPHPHPHPHPHHPHPQPHHYPITSAPSASPVYEVVSGVSSASYHPSPSMTVTSSGVSYAPVAAPMPAPRIMHNDHVHPNGHQQWSGPNVGVGNLHHQHAPAGHNNLSDLLYDEDMLGTF